MFASHYGQKSGDATDVKIINLNKITTTEDLRIRLSRFNTLDIKLVKCKKDKVNYAYVRLVDRNTAERLVSAVHNKLEVHSNLLRAILREDQSTSYENTLRKNLDIHIVELLVYDQDVKVSEEELKSYFTQYGPLDSKSTIHEGHPRLLHVRYANAVSAHAARQSSPHDIANTTVIALPLPTPEQDESEERKFRTTTFPCDSVVIESAEKMLRELHDSIDLKVHRKKSKILVHTHGELEGLTQSKIQRTIRMKESAITQIQVEFHQHCLPILAEPDTLKRIEEIKIPFEVKVKRGSAFVTLQTLQRDYDLSSCSIKSFGIKQYLSPTTSAIESMNHQWYWQDDNNDYQPCTDDVNKIFEQKFPTERHVVQQIGRFVYIINFDSMKQINVSTGKTRPLKRLQIQSEEAFVLTMQLKAHQDNISHLKRSISSVIMKFIAQAKIQVPNSTTQTDSFQGTLEAIKKRFVQVTIGKDSTISVQGKKLLVAEAEAELHKEALKIVAEKSFQVTVPHTWEAQSSKCELKTVTRGTPEWNNIQDKMSQPDFRIQIIKIERIQNTWLWELYQLSKKRMSEKNDGEVNEKALFHGTRQTSPKDIYDSEQGFDSRLASKGIYGEGTYFAVPAKYSHSYAHTIENGYKQMFLAQVITGVSCKLSSRDSSLKVPPKKEEHASLATLLHMSKFKGERYDSVTGTSNGSKIYIIYELGRVYPAYLITYSY